MRAAVDGHRRRLACCEQFTLRPGDVLLAEDTAGSGHQWRLEGTDPWRRMYVVLADGADVPFVPY